MINFISLKQKENFLYEEGRNRQEKTVSKLQSLQKKSTEFIKVKVNGTLNDVSKITNYDSIDFENLT